MKISKKNLNKILKINELNESILSKEYCVFNLEFQYNGDKVDVKSRTLNDYDNVIGEIKINMPILLSVPNNTELNNYVYSDNYVERDDKIIEFSLTKKDLNDLKTIDSEYVDIEIKYDREVNGKVFLIKSENFIKSFCENKDKIYTARMWHRNIDELIKNKEQDYKIYIDKPVFDDSIYKSNLIRTNDNLYKDSDEDSDFGTNYNIEGNLTPNGKGIILSPDINNDKLSIISSTLFSFLNEEISSNNFYLKKSNNNLSNENDIILKNSYLSKKDFFDIYDKFIREVNSDNISIYNYGNYILIELNENEDEKINIKYSLYLPNDLNTINSEFYSTYKNIDQKIFGNKDEKGCETLIELSINNIDFGEKLMRVKNKKINEVNLIFNLEKGFLKFEDLEEDNYISINSNILENIDNEDINEIKYKTSISPYSIYIGESSINSKDIKILLGICKFEDGSKRKKYMKMKPHNYNISDDTFFLLSNSGKI